ncbi:MAG TPA: hypothetical protein VNX68_13485 [Nitrosopumilaceae archaeon]|jgi:hypothetical protein|nr:hypothetical protein [Nitrosopumilaceae archaeon]
MACIKIDDKLQKSQQLSDFFTFLLLENRLSIPRLGLTKILLAKARPGLDSDVTSNAIISRFSEFGIPNGPLENGQPNVMELFTKGLIEEIYDSIHNEMRVDVAVDPGIVVNSTGANSGGPVPSVGSNPLPAEATGIPS